MVPGLAGGIELLGPLASLLSANYQVITYQLRGEDDCFAMRRRFDLSDLVGDLGEIIDWFGLEQTAVLGVSFGGLLALEYAAKFPSRLRRLAVQGVGARFESGLLQQVAGAVLRRTRCLRTMRSSISFSICCSASQGPSPLFEFVTQQSWQTDQSVMAHRFGLAQSFNMDNRLDRIGTPTLVLAGTRDLLVSQRSLRKLAEGVADSRVVKLRNEGHLAFVTCPHTIAREVHGFLESAKAE